MAAALRLPDGVPLPEGAKPKTHPVESVDYDFCDVPDAVQCSCCGRLPASALFVPCCGAMYCKECFGRLWPSDDSEVPCAGCGRTLQGDELTLDHADPVQEALVELRSSGQVGVKCLRCCWRGAGVDSYKAHLCVVPPAGRRSAQAHLIYEEAEPQPATARSRGQGSPGASEPESEGAGSGAAAPPGEGGVPHPGGTGAGGGGEGNEEGQDIAGGGPARGPADMRALLAARRDEQSVYGGAAAGGGEPRRAAALQAQPQPRVAVPPADRAPPSAPPSPASSAESGNGSAASIASHSSHEAVYAQLPAQQPAGLAAPSASAGPPAAACAPFPAAPQPGFGGAATPLELHHAGAAPQYAAGHWATSSPGHQPAAAHSAFAPAEPSGGGAAPRPAGCFAPRAAPPVTAGFPSIATQQLAGHLAFPAPQQPAAGFGAPPAPGHYPVGAAPQPAVVAAPPHPGPSHRSSAFTPLVMLHPGRHASPQPAPGQTYPPGLGAVGALGGAEQAAPAAHLNPFLGSGGGAFSSPPPSSGMWPSDDDAAGSACSSTASAMRRDPTNDCWYTRQEFLGHYGQADGQMRWEAAAHPQPPAGAAAGPAGVAWPVGAAPAAPDGPPVIAGAAPAAPDSPSVVAGAASDTRVRFDSGDGVFRTEQDFAARYGAAQAQQRWLQAGPEWLQTPNPVWQYLATGPFEKRVDPEDGREYNLLSFTDQYGVLEGLSRWVQAGQTPGGAAPAAATAGSAGSMAASPPGQEQHAAQQHQPGCVSTADADIQTQELAAGHSSRECVICRSSRRDVLFLPCRHCVCCSDCAAMAGPMGCVICRKPISAMPRLHELKPFCGVPPSQISASTYMGSAISLGGGGDTAPLQGGGTPAGVAATNAGTCIQPSPPPIGPAG